MNGDYNPRYIAYACSLDLMPDDALASDEEKYPGGKMCGFILWIQSRWAAWDKMHGHRRDHVRSQDEQTAFTEWLMQA